MFNPMAMMNMMIRKNPQLAQYVGMAQQMTQGKSPEQIQQIANNLAKQNGIDLNEVTNQMQQFMGGNMGL